MPTSLSSLCCPFCDSRHIAAHDYGRKTGAVLGATAGALIGALVGGVAGGTAGASLGKPTDKLLVNYECLSISRPTKKPPEGGLDGY